MLPCQHATKAYVHVRHFSMPRHLPSVASHRLCQVSFLTKCCHRQHHGLNHVSFSCSRHVSQPSHDAKFQEPVRTCHLSYLPNLGSTSQWWPIHATTAIKQRMWCRPAIVDDVLYTDLIIDERRSFRCRWCSQIILALVYC